MSQYGSLNYRILSYLAIFSKVIVKLAYHKRNQPKPVSHIDLHKNRQKNNNDDDRL